MKKITKKVKMLILVTAGICYNLYSHAATFTAATSGNWSSSLTWGGTTPPSILSSDDIVIPAGIAVDLDTDVEINGLLAFIDIDGELNSTTNNNLMVTEGNLTGAGDIQVGELTLGLGSAMGYSGTIECEKLINRHLNIAISAQITVNQSLELQSGIISLDNGSNLILATNSTVVVDNGDLLLNGGLFTSTNTHNLTVIGGSKTLGAEAEGSGLNNVTINLDNSSNSASLGGDVTINGTLSISNGEFHLNGQHLSLNGDIDANSSGTITGSSNSDLTVNTNANNSGAITFTSGQEIVNNLTINAENSGSIKLGSEVTVTGMLSISQGTFDLNGNNFILKGDIDSNGSGTIKSGASSDITVDLSTALNGELSFESSNNEVGNLTIDVFNGGNVELGSDVIVTGTLVLDNGKLVLNGNDLTIEGNLSGNGNGTISTDASSNITINTITDLSGALILTDGNNGLNSLTIDIQDGGTAQLGSEVIINGDLDLQSGDLDLNGNDLTLNGDFMASTSSKIEGDVTSSITINSSSNLSSMLTFSANDKNVEDLSINLSNSGEVTLGSNVIVNGDLDLKNGDFNLNSNDLTINGDISSTSTGNIVSSNNSNITVNSNASLTGELSFDSNNQEVNDFTINIDNNGSVMLGSDIDVAGTIQLTAGTLALNENNLFISGDLIDSMFV